MPARIRNAIKRRSIITPWIIRILTRPITRRPDQRYLPVMMPIPILTVMSCRPIPTPRGLSSLPRR
jgi:hypothetical protein